MTVTTMTMVLVLLLQLVFMVIIELSCFIIMLLFSISNAAQQYVLLPLYDFLTNYSITNTAEHYFLLCLYDFPKKYMNRSCHSAIRTIVLEETLKLVAETDMNCLMSEVWTEDTLAHEVKVNFDSFLSHSELNAETKAAVTQEYKKYVKEIYGFKDLHGYSIFGSEW